MHKNLINDERVLARGPDGEWYPAIPEPYPHGLFSFLWKRLTGWRDAYGRKAALFWENPND